MKRIVVSGASGFLGSNIVKNAVDKSIPILAITTRVERLQYPSVKIIRTDDFVAGKTKLSNDDVFINCLFPTNADGIKMANGLKTAYAMISAAKESGVGAFINISSQSVYDSNRIEPADENSLISLDTPYSVGKYSCEAFVNEVFKNLPHTNIRLASLLGAGYEQRIVNRMITNALKGEKLKVIGGMQQYGFLDVRDAASGLVHISQSEGTLWKEIYNLGRMESCTLLELTDMIIKKTQEYGLDTAYDISEGTDTRNSALNCQLFMNEFSWKPEITLEQTIDDIIKARYKV